MPFEQMNQQDKEHLVWVMKVALGYAYEEWTEEFPWPAAFHDYHSTNCAIDYLGDHAANIPLVMATLIVISTTHDDDWAKDTAFHHLHQIATPPDWNALTACLALFDNDISVINDGVCHLSWHARPYYDQTVELFKMLRPNKVEGSGM